MNKKRNIFAASILALAVTAGSGVFVVGNASAAEAVQKAVAHFGGKGFFHHSTSSTELASLLGLTVDELKTALTSGKSLAAIAAEKGVDVQKVIDLQVTTLTAALDKQLAAGKITQAQYDEQKAKLTTKATSEVNAVFNGSTKGKDGLGGFGHRGFGHFGALDNASLAKLLGLTTDELKTALTSGKSLATLAAEKNVTVQAVTDLITTQFKAELDKQLAAGTITQAKYDELKAALSTKASEFVNNTFKSKAGDEGIHGRKGSRGANGLKRTAPTDGTSGASAAN